MIDGGAIYGNANTAATSVEGRPDERDDVIQAVVKKFRRFTHLPTSISLTFPSPILSTYRLLFHPPTNSYLSHLPIRILPTSPFLSYPPPHLYLAHLSTPILPTSPLMFNPPPHSYFTHLTIPISPPLHPISPTSYLLNQHKAFCASPIHTRCSVNLRPEVTEVTEQREVLVSRV